MIISITIFYEAWNILYDYYNNEDLNSKLEITEEEIDKLYSNLTKEERKEYVIINLIGDKSYLILELYYNTSFLKNIIKNIKTYKIKVSESI